MERKLSRIAATIAACALLALTGCSAFAPFRPDDSSRVHGMTYVLVGSSSGLGEGVALKLAANGANLVLAARRADALEEVAAKARAAGATALVVPMDVSRPEDVRRLADAAVARFGHVDAWIDFAAVGAIGPFWTIPIEDHARVVDINLKGLLYASYAALRLFEAQGHGTLVNIGSVESEVPLAYHASYSATKAAIRAFDQAVNQELRLAGKADIHVVTVEPWAIDTPFFAHAANYSGGTPRMAAMDPPTDVVQAIVWVSLHPRAELPVGWKAQSAWFSHRLAPHTTERLSADIVHHDQFDTAPPAPATDGSLFTPLPVGRGVDDGVRARMRREDDARKAAGRD